MPVANLAEFGITGQHQSNFVDEEDAEESQAMPPAGEDTFAALHEETAKLNNAIDAVDKWLARKAPHLACLDAGVRRALHAEDSPSPAMRAWRTRLDANDSPAMPAAGADTSPFDEEKLDGDSYPSDEEAMMRSVEAEIDAKYERRHRQEELAARASADYQKALVAARQSADHELFDDAYPELSRGLMARERDAERPNLVLKIGRQSGDRKHPQGPGQFFGPKWLEVDGGRNAIAGDAAGTFDGPALNGALLRAADVVANWREHAKENAHSWQAYVSVTSPSWTPRGERSDPFDFARRFPCIVAYGSRKRYQYVAVGRADKYTCGPTPALCRVVAGRDGAAKVLWQNDAAETVDEALALAEEYLAANVVKTKGKKRKL